MRKMLMLCVALHAPAALAAYRCVDERGLTHIGDTPPPGCANVMMYEVRPNGQVVRAIEPTLTPEQAKTRAADLERKREADRLAAEQKRKDSVLLSTFANEREFDVVRDRSVAPIKSRIDLAQERIQAVDKRTKAIDEEMEFYKAGKGKAAKDAQPPHNLVAEQERLKGERQALVASIAGFEKEIAAVRARFDEDKRRWVALKAGGNAQPAAAPAAQPVKTTPK